jgi:hypothetical protein
MTHTEFILTVKKPIRENSGYPVSPPPIHYDIGDTITVNEQVFNDLQNGKIIERFSGDGIIIYDKYNFENEVQFTKVTVEYGSRKLGQRKK